MPQNIPFRKAILCLQRFFYFLARNPLSSFSLPRIVILIHISIFFILFKFHRHHTQSADNHWHNHAFAIPHPTQFQPQTTIFGNFLLFLLCNIDVIRARNIDYIAFSVLFVTYHNIRTVEDMGSVSCQRGVPYYFHIFQRDDIRGFMGVPFGTGLNLVLLADSMVAILRNSIVSIQILFFCKDITSRQYVGHGFRLCMAYSTLIIDCFL